MLKRIFFSRLISCALVLAMLLSLMPSGIGAASASKGGSEKLTPSPSTELNSNWNSLIQHVTDAAIQGASNSPADFNRFNDVESSDWFYDAVIYVQQHGLFDGTGNGYFSPNNKMTRAMFVTVLGRMAAVDIKSYATSVFSDVEAAAWYAPYVQWAVESGLTSGVGNNKFAPHATLTKEQMATFMVRFFDTFEIPYPPNSSIVSKPKDLADVAPWAADAVITLWRAGLINGDSYGNFNPLSNATRAIAAAFLMRSNEIVKKGRASSSPTAPETTPEATPEIPYIPTPPVSPPVAGVYTIAFDTNGGSEIGSYNVNANTSLTDLPIPYKPGYEFLAWYSDSQLTMPVDYAAKVRSNQTLYAKYEAILNPPFEAQRIPSVSMLDQDKTFKVIVTSEWISMSASEVNAGITFEALSNPKFATETGIKVTGSNGEFTISANNAEGAFEEGGTYKLTLINDKLIYKGQDETTRTFVFTISKEEVQHIGLRDDLIELPISSLMSRSDVNVAVAKSNALFSIQTDGQGNYTSHVNTSEGSFVYSGSETIEVGDTVALYEGIAPRLRGLDTPARDNGAVQYVAIRNIDAAANTYYYGAADYKGVLFIPDIFTIDQASTTATVGNGSITVPRDELLQGSTDFDESSVVEVGDYIAFYSMTGNQVDFERYVAITGVNLAGDEYNISFSVTSLDEIKQSMDYYDKGEVEGEQLLENLDISSLAAQIETQAVESGFVNKATEYLAALAMETDSFKKLKSDLDLEGYEPFYPGSANKNLVRIAGNAVTLKEPKITAQIGTNLTHFQGESGISAILQVSADLVITTGETHQVVINLTGRFEQELVISHSIIGAPNVDMDSTYINTNYTINSNIDVYTFTGMSFDAKMGTFGVGEKEDEWDWDDNNSVQNIAMQLKEVMDAKEGLESELDAAGIDSIANSLPQLYQNMLENDTDWVDIIEQRILNVSVRLLAGAIEVTLTGDFVVSAQVNATIGASFTYEKGDRYIFNVNLGEGAVTNETASLSSEKYSFTFYIVGTLGVKAGMRMTLSVGLINASFNNAGLQLEEGVYVKLRGYFFYQFTYSSPQSTNSKAIGAMNIEIGAYAKLKFVAQAFAGTFSFAPKLFEKERVLLTIGEHRNVIDFSYGEDEVPIVDLHGELKEITLPSSVYMMETIDMRDGTVASKEYDRTLYFDVTISNANFKYDKTSNKIIVMGNNVNGMEAKMTITWKSQVAAFHAKPLSRTIPLYYDDFEDNYSIRLYSIDGSGQAPRLIKNIKGKYGMNIAAIPDPVRKGYTFKHWYGNAADKSIAQIPNQMPAENLTYYALWEPATDTRYQVEHYLYNIYGDLNFFGDYTKTLYGTTNQYASYVPINIPHYETPPVQNVMIKADGSTVVKYIYSIAYYNIVFDSGLPGMEPVRYSLNNLSFITPPSIQSPGWVFRHWVAADDITQTPIDFLTMWHVSHRDVTYLGVYDRQYQVTFDADGGLGGKKAYLREGEAIRPPLLRKPGYVLTGWTPSLPATMPSADQTYKAIWEPAEAFRVEHYFQNLNNEAEYTREYTTTHYGLIGASVSAPTRTINGFTFDDTSPNNVLTGTVASDGTLVLKVHYVRNVYEVKFTIGTTDGKDVEQVKRLKYGEYVNLPYMADFGVHLLKIILEIDMGNGVVQKFAGWESIEDNITLQGNEKETMPAHNLTFIPLYK